MEVVFIDYNIDYMDQSNSSKVGAIATSVQKRTQLQVCVLELLQSKNSQTMFYFMTLSSYLQNGKIK